MKTLALASAGLALAGHRRAYAVAPQAVRARGRVLVDGRPRAAVGISDGRQVVLTDAQGAFQLDTDTTQGFLQVVLPGDVQVPVSPAGTAAFYRPITPGVAGAMTAEFRLATVPGRPDRHTLLLLADPQVQHAADLARLHAEAVPEMRRVARALADRHPVGIACGDIMYDRLEHLGEWERALRDAGLPGFQLPGNHDVDILARTDADSTRVFQQRFGPTWYSFDRGDVHIIALDDVLWNLGSFVGHIDRQQQEWLAADLAHVEAGRRVLVCVHIPTWCERHLRNGLTAAPDHLVVANRERLYDLLRPYRATILCGHMHELEILRDGPVDVHVCGAVCGAWWSGDVCGDGTPNGFMVYDIDGDQLRWRYQATGRPADHQLRLYAPGADPERPQSVVANVWAHEPSWQVVWYADGERRGAMTRHRGLDPRACELLAGDDRPAGRTWADPLPTDHLFSCRPDAGVREVTVEATDGWGRVYRERIAV
ncbi:MAG: calcineurin-like phosphoesterase family protein [Candidatus Krumholzibacteriia bacterium]